VKNVVIGSTGVVNNRFVQASIRFFGFFAGEGNSMKESSSTRTTAFTIALLIIPFLPFLPDGRMQFVEKLCEATMSGNYAEMEKFLNMGADINARDKSGMTPLIWAAVKGHAHATQILIERGAEVNERNAQGDSPLMWAAVMGHEQVVELILENNPDVNARSKKNGVTALMAAAAKGHANVVHLLINHGAEVNVKDRNQNTALMHAATKRFPDVVNALLSAGASYRGSKPSSTLSAWVFLSPRGEYEGIELYRMGEKTGEETRDVNDAFLWLNPREVPAFSILETRWHPFFPGIDPEPSIRQIPPV
jgi:uncharacterized protein